MKILDAKNDLNLLDPRVRDIAVRFKQKCLDSGNEILIIETFRTAERQNYLYVNRKTLAKAGWSYHQYGLAFDFCPLTNGQPDWNNKAKWQVCGKIAEDMGLEWGARWKTFPDSPHLQFTFGLSIQNLYAGKKPPTENETPSKWAEIAWNKAVKSGVITKLPHANITKEELAVVFDKLGLLK